MIKQRRWQVYEMVLPQKRTEVYAREGNDFLLDRRLDAPYLKELKLLQGEILSGECVKGEESPC